MANAKSFNEIIDSSELSQEEWEAHNRSVGIKPGPSVPEKLRSPDIPYHSGPLAPGPDPASNLASEIPEMLRSEPSTPEITLREQEEMDYWANSEVPQLRTDEGFRKGVYQDSVGIDTIGYGFNLERGSESENALKEAGIEKSVSDLRNGTQKLTQPESERLMRLEVPKFEGNARDFVGKETWDSLDPDKKKVLTNMAFNMGPSRLGKFVNFKQAIQDGDWPEAQVQMENSKWYDQVGDRAKRLVDRMGAADSYRPGVPAGYDVRNIFNDYDRENFDVSSAISEALRRG